MANESKNEKKGFTVGELEGKFRKYGMEITLCVIFILSLIFAFVWGRGWITWSIILCMIGGIVGALLPNPLHVGAKSTLNFICKEKVTSIVAAVIGILIAIFISPIIFAIVGLMAGKSLVVMVDRDKVE